MALEGTLKDFNLPDIFQLIGYQKKTGLLALSRETEHVTVSLVDGMVVWASPGEEAFDELVGRALAKGGLISQTLVEELTRKRRETQQGLVYLLLKQGDVPPLELQRVVETKVREVLYRVFRWRDGRYQFTALPTVDLSQGRIDPISAENLLLEAIRQMDEWPLIQRHLPSMESTVRKDEERLGALEVDKLTPGERLVLELVDGKATARDIAEVSGLGEFDTAKAIADLIADGALALAAGGSAERETVQATRAPRETPAWLFRGLVVGILAAAFFAQVGLWQHDPLLLLPAAGKGEAGWELLRQHKLQADLREVEGRIHLYLLTTGRLPARLEALVEGGYLAARQLRDPWGQPLRYQVQGLEYRLEGSRPLRPSPQ
ncbi:MAG TPA: DUF4388 domain-containing protein [Candidatus Methylomirabilis sp.]|jgi:hypothetical protein|nr:DUF4388 domain-containing protein [Candidatus Methylomirabilis sp.]